MLKYLLLIILAFGCNNASLDKADLQIKKELPAEVFKNKEVVITQAQIQAYERLVESFDKHPVLNENKSIKPVISTSAEQLYRAYHKNEIGADMKYKGNSLLITGVIDELRTTFLDEAVIDLKTQNKYSSIHAYISDSYKIRVADLNKGDTITIVCEGDGMILGSPILKSCYVN